MANIELLIPKIKKWEGGFVNDPADAGGATNMGITLETFRRCGYDKDGDGDIDVDDLRLINTHDFSTVMKLNYWDRWRADYILSQSIAEILVDWVWASGKYGIEYPQNLLRVKVDGQVGAMTISAINNHPDKERLHRQIFDLRMGYIDGIVKRSVEKYMVKNPRATNADLLKNTNLRFQKGWKNRLNDSYKTFVS